MIWVYKVYLFKYLQVYLDLLLVFNDFDNLMVGYLIEFNFIRCFLAVKLLYRVWI